MADRHIDYDEVSEYGNHLLSMLPSLDGVSLLIDLAKLQTLVTDAVKSVETELQKTTSDRSALRGERSGTAEASDALRDVLTRFYYFLRSLPKNTDFDFDALFQGQTMGDLGHLKAADLAAKAGDVLRGFDNAKNNAVGAFTGWKGDIAAARQNLSDKLAGKGSAAGGAFKATSSLVQARKDFLRVYTKVAKPLVKAQLAHVGRENEWPQFFKDLTVNEGGTSKPAADTPTEP